MGDVQTARWVGRAVQTARWMGHGHWWVRRGTSFSEAAGWDDQYLTITDYLWRSNINHHVKRINTPDVY